MAKAGGTSTGKPHEDGPTGYARSLVEMLAELRAQSGNPSYREIAEEIPSAKEDASTSAGYINEVFHGKKIPSGDMTESIVEALGGDQASRLKARRYAEEAASDRNRLSVKPAEPKPVIPRQLPAAVSHFAGRTGELAALNDLLPGQADPGRTVVILAIGGTAGVGKTAIAVQWAHQVADRFPDGQLYIDLRGFGPSGSVMEPLEAVRWFLDALQVPPERIPVDLDAQAALYRNELAGKRMLVVLDNARDTAQVRPLLPGAPGCLVLITSRSQLTSLIATKGAHSITLDLLTRDEARELLAQRLSAERIAAEPEAAEEIIARCARLPLALAIVAARAALHPQLPLDALASELRDASGRLGALTTDDPDTDVQAVFSWSYQALTPDAARLFRLLGLHPGPDIGTPAAASLVGTSLSTVKPLLADLAQANLLVEHSHSRYTFHDLLRTYATYLTHTTDTTQQRHSATHRILDHYLHTAHAAARLLDPARDDPTTLTAPHPGTTVEHLVDHDQALAWFITEHAVLLTSVEHAATTGFDTHIWQLAWTLANYLNRSAHWHDWIVIGQAELAAAHRLGNPTTQARSHRHLAYAYIQLDRFDDAHTHLQNSLRLTSLIGDVIGQANTHQGLAQVWGRQGRHAEALEHARQAFATYRTAGHRSGQALALNTIGWCEAELGNHRQAITNCKQALTLFQEISDRVGQADTWDSLGYAQHHLGHHALAIASYHHALSLWRDAGNRYLEADVLIHIGDTHHSTSDFHAARDAWQQALTILCELDHPDAEQVRAKLDSLDNPTSESVASDQNG